MPKEKITSYLIVFQTAASKKPFSTVEEIIKPCLVEACSEVLGPTASDKVKTIHLSNDMLAHRIDELYQQTSKFS
jgi:hypothetical protein